LLTASKASCRDLPDNLYAAAAAAAAANACCRRQVLLTAAKQVAKWSLPSFVCRDNVGVANIGSRTAMVEARCSRLKG
jgi:hypothetical protein